MKTGILAVAAVVVGCLAGVATNWAEFHGVVESTFEPKSINLTETSRVSGPRALFVNGESYNFGTQEVDTSASHVFVLKNIGDAPLNIEKGDTTCKCTVSELENGSIPPGESVNITLKWEAVDPAQTVDFRQVARFRTNDPQRPLIELLVHGFVTRSVRAKPEELVINRISANEMSTVQFNLIGYQDDSFEVVEHHFENEDTADFFEVEFREMSADEVQAEPKARCGLAVVVHIRPGLPLGALEQVLHLKTNLADNSEVDVPIHGSVISDISVVGRNFSTSKNLLTMGIVKQSEGARADLHILVKGPHRHDVKLKVVSTEPSDILRATVGEPDLDNDKILRYPLTIEIPPGSRQASWLSSDPKTAAKVILETTHPQAKDVQVMVRFAIEG